MIVLGIEEGVKCLQRNNRKKREWKEVWRSGCYLLKIKSFHEPELDTMNEVTDAQQIRILQRPTTSGVTSNKSDAAAKNGGGGDTGHTNENKLRRKARGSRGSIPGGVGGDAAGPTGAANENDRQARKPKLKMAKKKEEDLIARQFKMMQDEVNNGLRNCESGRELDVLHRCLRPDHHLLWYKCIEVKKDLVNALYRLYPMVRLEVFGSTVMGMAFKDSDFDFYIEVSPNQADINPAKVIRESMRLLGRSGNFTNFTPITHARVPILKCYHVKTGYHCDLNFSDSLGVLNSPILGHLITYDTRIYMLATIIKYWMKVHDCSGTNRITNYAVLWMLIFYLQTIPEPIVPPVTEFQRYVREYIVHSFNFAFDYNYPNNTKNRQRASELLVGFFQFYKDFDFETQLICPLHGRTFSKNDVATKRLPEFKRYEDILKMNRNELPMQMKKPICIQDPFDITHTVPGAIAANVFQRIQSKISYAAEMIANELNTAGETTNLLLNLFDAVKFEKHADGEMQKKNRENVSHVKIERRSSNALSVSYTPTEAELFDVRDILTKSMSKERNELIDQNDVNKFWAEHAIKYIVKMLEEIFLVELKIRSPDENSSESITTNSETILRDSSDKFLKEFEIVGTQDVLVGRKLVKNIDEHTLQKEIRISQRLLSKTIKMNLRADLKISADLENFNRLALELNDLIKTKKNNQFRTFSTCFQHHSRQFLKAYFVQARAACASLKTSTNDITSDTTNGGDPNKC